jgi:phage gp46-like protein
MILKGGVCGSPLLPRLGRSRRPLVQSKGVRARNYVSEKAWWAGSAVRMDIGTRGALTTLQRQKEESRKQLLGQELADGFELFKSIQ